MEYLRFDVKSDIPAPMFVGSSVRGALGAALKSVVCVNPAYECEGCFGAQGCLYYDLYERRSPYHDYRLDIELSPGTYRFGLVLFGQVMERYPYILSAIEKMFVKKGLGARRQKSENFEIWCDGEAVYRDGDFARNVQIKPKSLQNDRFCPSVRVRYVTPLRIKKGGRITGPEDIEPKDVMVSVAKKLEHFGEGRVEFGSVPRVVERKLRFLDLQRYSNRQRTKMKIGGVVGEMVLEGVDETAYRLFRAAEVLGAGKLGTFGLGKVVVEDLV